MPLKWKIMPFLFLPNGFLLTHYKSRPENQLQDFLQSVLPTVSHGSVLCLSGPGLLVDPRPHGMLLPQGFFPLFSPSFPRDLNGSLDHHLQIFAQISPQFDLFCPHYRKEQPCTWLCFTHTILLLLKFPLELILSIYFTYLSYLLSVFMGMWAPWG